MDHYNFCFGFESSMCSSVTNVNIEATQTMLHNDTEHVCSMSYLHD